MKRCAYCIMPETKPGILFDENGVCNACQNSFYSQKIDWEVRWNELVKIVNKAKKKKDKYNCVIAVSGGKDSTFLAVTTKEKLGLTPLLVCVEPLYPTELGKKNLNNLSNLGFDIFVFKPNQKIMPHLLKRSFYEHGQPVRAFEFILYSVPMQIAMNYGVPIVFWGENSQFEYGNLGRGLSGSANEQKSCCAIENKNADYWTDDEVVISDLTSFQHPSKDELDCAGIESLYMSHYVKWDSRKIGKFAIERGLSVRPKREIFGTGGYWYAEQLDDEIPIISHLIKYFKYGYGRATDQACRDIRWGYIAREEGLFLAKQYDGHCNPDYIKRYCNYINISIEEFWKVANSFRNKDIWFIDKDGAWRLIDG